MSPDPQPQVASLDEKLTSFDSVPLFMKSLPEQASDTDDAALGALQSLAHEGTPDEIAQNFKEQGNDYYKGRRFREATGFYSQGIDAKPDDQELLEALLCNRAACQLELSNYGSVLKDCSRALGINAKSSKAMYRSARALLALERLDEALDCCTRCLTFDPENSGVKEVQGKILAKKELAQKKEREKQDRLEKENQEKRRLDAALKERHIIRVAKTRTDASPPPYAPSWEPAAPISAPELLFPVFFLYPQYATSDLIESFPESSSFGEHLSTMFPPVAPPLEWDKKGEYVNDGRLVAYAMTHRGRLLKVGRKMTLKQVCKAAAGKDGVRDGLEMAEGCLSFAILTKGEVEERWVREWKSTHPT